MENKKTQSKKDKKYLQEREAVKQSMKKMEKELEKPEVMAVFKRLKYR